MATVVIDKIIAQFYTGANYMAKIIANRND